MFKTVTDQKEKKRTWLEMKPLRRIQTRSNQGMRLIVHITILRRITSQLLKQVKDKVVKHVIEP
jgi:hypothetical protein